MTITFIAPMASSISILLIAKFTAQVIMHHKLVISAFGNVALLRSVSKGMWKKS